MIIELLRKTPEKSAKHTQVRDRPIRSIVKSVTWRIVGTLDTILLSYLVTGKAVMALSIGSFEVFTKMLLYFLHERLWAIVRWGRMLVVIRKNTRRVQKLSMKLFLYANENNG